jgi:hypothetical protein
MSLRYGRPADTPDGEGRFVSLDASSSNPVVLTQLVAVVNGARLVEGHRCSPRGFLTLEYSHGPARTMGFIQGHHDSFYELTDHHGFWRVKRNAWLSVVAAMGMDSNEMPR